MFLSDCRFPVAILNNLVDDGLLAGCGLICIRLLIFDPLLWYYQFPWFESMFLPVDAEFTYSSYCSKVQYFVLSVMFCYFLYLPECFRGL